MLLLVQLLEVCNRVLVLRIEPQHLREGLDRPIHEAAAAIVETEAEKHVGVFELSKVGALQEALVLLNRAAHLPLLAIQVSQDQMDFERIAGDLRGFLQLVDRRIDLVGDEKVQPEHVVGRFPRATPIGPDAFTKLVSLPRFPDREAQEKRHQASEQDDRGHRGSRSA